MTKPSGQFAWHLTNVAAAAVVSLFLLWVVAFINTRFSVVEVGASEIPIINLQAGEPGGGGSTGSSAPSNSNALAPEKLMTVDLDQPASIMPTVPSIALDLPLPSIADVPVDVSTTSGMPKLSPSSFRLAIANWTARQGQGTGSGLGGTESGGGRGAGSGTGSGDGSGGQGGDAVDQPPREVYGNSVPEYPLRERNLGIEDTVTMQLLVDESGRVADVKLLDGGEAFREAVMAKVWQWRFAPAIDDGRPVKVWATKRFKFVISRG